MKKLPHLNPPDADVTPEEEQILFILENANVSTETCDAVMNIVIKLCNKIAELSGALNENN